MSGVESIDLRSSRTTVDDVLEYGLTHDLLYTPPVRISLSRRTPIELALPNQRLNHLVQNE